MSFSEADRRFMNAALALGRRGLGQVWPRPSVGCVLVKDGRIVGRGRTQVKGTHAEVMALRQAGAAARGSTAYVTLEPCAHHGRTPPCAQALTEAGIARCVVAIEDPDSRVNGAGVTILRAAGILVEIGLCARQAKDDQAGFLLNIRQKRPFLTLKLAMSLDGRIATASGESRWITGPQARSVVHSYRANHDAVLIGGGTARADNPELTVRGMGNVQQPVRVVASRYLDLPTGSKLSETAKDSPVWLLHGEGGRPVQLVRDGCPINQSDVRARATVVPKRNDGDFGQ